MIDALIAGAGIVGLYQKKQIMSYFSCVKAEIGHYLFLLVLSTAYHIATRSNAQHSGRTPPLLRPQQALPLEKL